MMSRPRRSFQFALFLSFGLTVSDLQAAPEESQSDFGAIAKLNGPAHFVVRPEVVAENPGAYTFTTDSVNVNAWLQSGNFEPFSRRTKLHALGAAPDEIILRNSTISKSDSFKSGWFDGAKVRVYRIIDGVLTKVREDKIKEHIIEGWVDDDGSSVSGKILTGSSAQTYIQGWSRHDCNYYYSVVAISKSGNQSPPSNSITIKIPGEFPDKRGATSNTMVKFRRPRPATAEESLKAPTNFIAQLDELTGMITCCWTPSDNPEIVGYQLMRSDIDPAKHRGMHLYLENSPEDPAQHIHKGDMIFLDHEVFAIDKETTISNRVFNAGTFEVYPPYFKPSEDAQWKLVPHPAPVPDELAIDGGRTCVQVDYTGTAPVGFRQYIYGSLAQDHYKILDPNKTYIVEYWVKTAQGQTAEIDFMLSRPLGEEVPPMPFEANDRWQKFTNEFTVATLLTDFKGVGQMGLNITGEGGTVWLDNWRVYEKGTAWMDWTEVDKAELRKSGMGAYRSHAHIKTTDGYTMQGFTNTAGGIEWKSFAPNRFMTLPNQLRIMKAINADPWLQIEMVMSEEEWLGFVEYFCAPYDERTDTPQSKPWAYKRVRQGHPQPYLADFDRVLFEVANETWNRTFSPYTFLGVEMADGKTDRIYDGGEIYGIFQEYIISTLRSSPYWSDEAEEKFEFVLGGWAVHTDKNGYGAAAARMSPSSTHMTIAAYNGGWDEGESPSTPEPKGFFKALTVANRVHVPRARKFKALCEQEGGSYAVGTYEAGPGYNMNGLNGAIMTPEMTEQEWQTMKSLAAGTATLDVFLAQSRLGYKLQNFFTFGRTRKYWSSHARMENGGQAYPSWMGLELYNNEGQGDFLNIQTVNAPTWDFKAQKGSHRQALSNAPLMSVYATRSGDRLNVFVLSLKTEDYPVVGDDGMTLVQVDLPIKGAKKLTLYRMTGKPSDHNLDEELIKMERFELAPALATAKLEVNQASGGKATGMPPASTFLYVFEGVEWQASDAPVVELAPGQSTTTAIANIRFAIALPASATINPEAITISGSAGATAIASCTATSIYGEGTYEVVVTEIDQEGAITCSYQDTSATVQYRIPIDQPTTLAAWSFPAASEDGIVPDEVLKATESSPAIARPMLIYGDGYSPTENRYYNHYGLGLAPTARSDEDSPDAYIGWTVAPKGGRTIAIDQIMIGLWAQVKDAPIGILFEYSTDGFATSREIVLQPESPVQDRLLAQGGGVPAVVDLAKEAAFQNLTTPVEFRLHLFGPKPRGIGKLGKRKGMDVPDLVIKGRVLK